MILDKLPLHFSGNIEIDLSVDAIFENLPAAAYKFDMRAATSNTKMD